jgi:hypothetical protein
LASVQRGRDLGAHAARGQRPAGSFAVPHAPAEQLRRPSPLAPVDGSARREVARVTRCAGVVLSFLPTVADRADAPARARHALFAPVLDRRRRSVSWVGRPAEMREARFAPSGMYCPAMLKRILGMMVFCAMAFGSACSTLGGYPSEWHNSTDSIYVYVSDPSNMTKMPAAGKTVTLLDAVLSLGDTGGDLSRVVVERCSDAGMIRLEVDVRQMLLTGVTTQNILLQPGDVVGIPG